jgi:hypothetical protein
VFETEVKSGHSHFLEDDALGHTGTHQRVSLDGGGTVRLDELQVCPFLVTAVDAELATSADTGGLVLRAEMRAKYVREKRVKKRTLFRVKLMNRSSFFRFESNVFRTF